jgi:hypothetical protein
MLSKSLRRALIGVLIGGSPLVTFVACDGYPSYRHGGGVVVIGDGDDDDDFEDFLDDLEDDFDDDDFFDD